MYRRLIEFILRRPGLVLVGVLLVTLAFASTLPSLRVQSDVDDFIPRGDNALANTDQLEEIFGTPNFTMIVVMREDHPSGIYNPESLELIGEIVDWLSSRDEFESATNADLRSLPTANNIKGRDDDMVVEPFLELPISTQEQADVVRAAMIDNPIFVGSLTSYDGKGAAIFARASEYGEAHRPETYFLLRDFLDELNAKGHPEVFHLTGRPVVEGLFGIYIPAEGRRLTPAVVLFICALLFASFGTIRAVAIAVAVIACTEVWMFGFLAIWGRPIYTITSIIPVLIIAVSVADAIHLLAKYYEAQAEDPTATRDAVVRRTMSEMGAPVLMTSITTAIGFLAMTTSTIQPLRDFGVIMAAGIVAAFVLSVTLVPALLALLELRPSPRRKTGQMGESVGRLDPMLQASARIALRQPGTILAVTVVLALVWTYGSSLLHVDSSQIGQFRPGHHLRVADDVTNERFAGGTTLDLLIDGLEAGAMKRPDMLKRLERLQTELEATEYVGDTMSIAELVARMNRVMMGNDPAQERIPSSQDLVAQYLLLYSISGDPGDFDDLVDYDYRYAHVTAFIHDSGTAAAKTTVERAKELLATIFIDDDKTIADARLAGRAYTMTRLEHHIVQGQVLALITCIPVLAMINAITFGSIAMGLLTVLPVVLSILAAYGMMGLLGIPSDVATLMLGGMTLGIGVDFAIHYLHKYRSCRAKGLGHDDSVKITSTTAGRALFFNAAVLTGGFLVMLGAQFYPQVKLGALVSATMLVCYLATMHVFPAALSYTRHGRD